MSAPVGKSGPLTMAASSSVVVSAFSMSAVTASQISLRLCGGMFVAMPTAMPEAPLRSRLGMRAGSTIGSCRESSYVGIVSGVVLPQHLADDGGALAVRSRRPQVHLVHGVEDAALDGLQAVADIRKRTG